MKGWTSTQGNTYSVLKGKKEIMPSFKWRSLPDFRWKDQLLRGTILFRLKSKSWAWNAVGSQNQETPFGFNFEKEWALKKLLVGLPDRLLKPEIARIIFAKSRKRFGQGFLSDTWLTLQDIGAVNLFSITIKVRPIIFQSIFAGRNWSHDFKFNNSEKMSQTSSLGPISVD